MKRVMPLYAESIIRRLNAAGYEACAVGGCVRDTLLGRRPNDWDVATAAPAGMVQEIFPKTAPTGVKYGTVTVFCRKGKCEVTTFRRDGNYVNSRKPENVEFVSDVTEDLARRDFTVNAMAMTPDGEITDPFGGREDMEKKLLRCVGNAEERFNEDALRMLRAVRFSAQLGFDIEPETARAISACAPLAKNLSGERVREETEKIICSPRPEMLNTAVDAGLYDGVIENRCYVNLNGFNTLPKKPLIRWAALVSRMKNAGAVNDAESFLKAMRLDGKTVKLGCFAAEHGAEFDTAECAALAGEYGEEAVLCAAAAAGCYDKARRVLKRGFVTLRGLSVNGDDLKSLGMEGEVIGAALSRLLRLVNTGEASNVREELLKRI